MMNKNIAVDVSMERRRRASGEDLDSIMDLVRDAKRQMIQNNVYQWTKDYPNEQIVRSDIENGLVWFYGPGLKACVTIIEHADKCLLNRLMVRSSISGEGLARYMIDDVITRTRASVVEVTTNHTNRPMIHLLTREHFNPVNELIMKERSKFGKFITFQKYL